MNGYVDDQHRALLDLKIYSAPDSSSFSITVWIDTAFTGYLVMSKKLIKQLRMPVEGVTEAILADGNSSTLETSL